MTSKYVSKFLKMLQAFGEKFQEINFKQKEVNILVKLFNVEPVIKQPPIPNH